MKVMEKKNLRLHCKYDSNDDGKGSKLMNISYVPVTNSSRLTKYFFLSPFTDSSNDVSTNKEW